MIIFFVQLSCEFPDSLNTNLCFFSAGSGVNLQIGYRSICLFNKKRKDYEMV